MYGLSALHTRLSDPVAALFYFIFACLSNELQNSGKPDIIEKALYEERIRNEAIHMNSLMKSYFNALRGKRTAVLGIGVSNRPLIRLLLQYGISVTACDKTLREDLDPEVLELEQAGAVLHVGPDYLENLTADVVFRTPGMHPNIPALQKLREQGAVVTSEMEAFFSVCPWPIVAVTGSDGKTTTTTLIAEILRHAGRTVWIGGNIGQPLLPLADQMAPDHLAVVELSSFQLMNMTQSPHIAVVTNLAPNHLDIHKDMEEYVRAKKNIYLHQGKDDLLVLNLDNDITASFAQKAPGKISWFSRNTVPSCGAWLEGDTVYYEGKAVMTRSGILLPGMHNVENYMAALCATREYASLEDVAAVAASFGGVEHRIELVRTLDGVRYYNDSIASSPSRTIAGLHSFDQKVILIAGGYDKHIPFDVLGPEITSHVKRLILCGHTAEKIREAVLRSPEYREGAPEIRLVSSLEEAVQDAHAYAAPGDVVTLSPACAAFDQFKNFMVRGQVYKDLVRAL